MKKDKNVSKQDVASEYFVEYNATFDGNYTYNQKPITGEDLNKALNDLKDFHKDLKYIVHGTGSNTTNFINYDQVIGGPAGHLNYPYDLSSIFNSPLGFVNPECYILFNNNRLKEYTGIVYLEDSNEFEIEMFNYNTFTIGVKIKINGVYISNSHLVLYPGKRIKLDRFLDENRKFIFSTYIVDNSREAQSAILCNGLVELEFYQEYQRPQTYPTYPTYTYYCHNSNDIIGQDSTLTTMSFSDTTGEVTLDSLNTIETGIVGKGNISNTEFDNVNITFEAFTSYRKKFQILPKSQKPIEPKDLVRYCTDCGTKAKKDHNFCSKCGTKL